MSLSLKPRDAWHHLEAAQPPAWVLRHTRLVAGLARAMASRAQDEGHDVDVALVTAAGLLHDYGRAWTQDARHASLGAEKLRAAGFPEDLVRIVERHTGGGITKAEAVKLGIPRKDYTPQTLEERIVCHADNLYSGDKRLQLQDIRGKYMAKGLPEAWRRIHELHDTLSRELDVDLETLEPVALPEFDSDIAR